MEALEVNSKTDQEGSLHLKLKSEFKNTDVRVIVLLESNEDQRKDDLLLFKSLHKNSAFDFLSHESENIYSITDGDSIDD